MCEPGRIVSSQSGQVANQQLLRLWIDLDPPGILVVPLVDDTGDDHRALVVVRQRDIETRGQPLEFGRQFQFVADQHDLALAFAGADRDVLEQAHVDRIGEIRMKIEQRIDARRFDGEDVLQDAGRFGVMRLRGQIDVEPPQPLGHGPAKQRLLAPAESATGQVPQHVEKAFFVERLDDDDGHPGVQNDVQIVTVIHDCIAANTLLLSTRRRTVHNGRCAMKWYRFYALTLLLLTGLTSALSQNGTVTEPDRLYENFNSAYSKGDLEAALDWADRLIKAKEEIYGTHVPELVISLINYANVATELFQWEDAYKAAVRGLEIAEQHSGVKPQHEVMLLLTKSRTEIRLRKFKQARKSIAATLRLNQQIKPVDYWVEAEAQDLKVMLAKRDFDRRAGNLATQRSIDAREKYFGEETFRMAPYYKSAAEWYRWSTQFAKERKVHNQSIQVLEAEYGAQDVRLAIPLMGVAETYLMAKKSPQKTEAVLNRALSLDYPDSAEAIAIKSRVVVSLADFHTVSGSPEQATEYYREAWRLIADRSEFGSREANDFFASPVRLYFKQPDAPANTGKGNDYFEEGYVILAFDVNPQGRLENVEVIESYPFEMKEKLFFDAARRARYRPVVHDGEPRFRRGEQMRFSYSFDR